MDPNDQNDNLRQPVVGAVAYGPSSPPPLPDYTGYVRPEGGNGKAIDSTPVPIPDPDDGILTPERARAARERAHAEQRFQLTRTGGYALVRRLTATDRVAIGTLPSHQQQIVLNALARASDNANARKADGTISRPIALENMKRQEELVNAYCVAGFVRPRLILSENDRADPDEVLVTDLDMKDREAFFAWCETDSEAAARRVAAFPDGPLPGLGLG